MYVLINNKGVLEVYADSSDLCKKCQNCAKCPLIQAISKEYVIMRYSDVEINNCGLFKK